MSKQKLYTQKESADLCTCLCKNNSNKFKDGSSYACDLHYERSTSKRKKNPCRGVKLAHQTRG